MCFFLVFWLENIKQLCHLFREFPRVICVTYNVEVNEGEAIFIQLYPLLVLHPLTLKYGDL
jgi:hypothetical protein